MIGLWSTRSICTVLAFFRIVFWCDLWDRVRVKTHNCIVCNCVASAHCEWACAFSYYQLGQRTLSILNSCVLSPHRGWSCASSRSLALDTSVWSFLLWVNMWIMACLTKRLLINDLPFCFGFLNPQFRSAPLFWAQIYHRNANEQK